MVELNMKDDYRHLEYLRYMGMSETLQILLAKFDPQVRGALFRTIYGINI